MSIYLNLKCKIVGYCFMSHNDFQRKLVIKRETGSL